MEGQNGCTGDFFWRLYTQEILTMVYISLHFYLFVIIVAGGQDAQWEDTAAYYEDVCRDCELKSITYIYQYLDAVNNERYTILIAVKGDGTSFMEETVKQRFGEMVHRGSTRSGLTDFEITSGDTTVPTKDVIPSKSIMRNLQGTGSVKIECINCVVF